MKVAIVLAVLLAVSVIPVFAYSSDVGEDIITINYNLSEIFGNKNNPGGYENSSDSDHHSIKIIWTNDLEDGIRVTSTSYSVASPDYGTLYTDDWKFDSGELKLGDTVTYIFDKPGWYAYYSPIFPDVVNTVRIYDPETQCTLTGCDAYYLIGTPLSEIPDELELKVKNMRKQIHELETELEIKYSNLDPKGSGTSEEIQDMESEIQTISQEITMLSKNDPDCIALDKYHQCVYETEIIQDESTPNWFKTVITWYDEGLLTDDDFYYLVKYAIENNLIT